MISNWSEAELALCRQVGGGRSGGNGELSVSLAYGQVGGAGLLLALGRAAEACVWVREEQWCDWVAPVLPVSHFNQVPAELGAALASWTLAPLTHWLEAQGLPTPAVEAVAAGGLKPNLYCLLTLELQGRRLTLALPGRPQAWLTALADALEPVARPRAAVSLPLTVAAGWCRLPLWSLKTLTVGEALLLEGRFPRGRQSRFWLFQERPVARLRFDEHDNWKVEHCMDQMEDWLDTEPVVEGSMMLDDVMMTVVVEVGQAVLPLAALAALEPGQLLEVAASEDMARLKVNGKVIGAGQLLRIDDRMVLRVERLGSS